MKAKKSDTSYVVRMLVIRKLHSVKRKLEKVREDHYSLRISFQWTQNKLERVNGDWKEK